MTWRRFTVLCAAGFCAGFAAAFAVLTVVADRCVNRFARNLGGIP